jgi:hypothetical protein
MSWLWLACDVCGLCVTVTLAYVQNGASCLFLACQEGHLEVVKYLYEQGGKELLMLTINVSTFKLVDVEGFARMCIQMCIETGVHGLNRLGLRMLDVALV